ncbi:MAG: hypothetical protein WC089_00190 [Candidatus Paceibacterota bacterium]
MKKKNYLYITSIIFLIVGLVHFLKILTVFEIQIAGQEYPLWLSWIEMIIALYLSFLGFHLSKK